MLIGLLRCSGRQEINYYVEQYTRNGLHGPRIPHDTPLTPELVQMCSANEFIVNWYRNRHQNYEDERSYVLLSCSSN